MNDEKQLKEPDTLAKVLLLIPTVLFIINMVLFPLGSPKDRATFVTLSNISGWILILHVFPGCILSIIGLIRTIGRKKMGFFRFLGFSQLILDVILAGVVIYAIYHA